MALVPMDQRDGWIWYDGEMVPWKDAKIHVLTHGLHYASCVFEGERAYGGEVFKLREHTERLICSGKTLDFTIPYSADEIDERAAQVLAKNDLVDAYMRPVAWRGSETLSVPARNNTVHLAIAAWVWPSYFSTEERLKGIRLELGKWKRPSPETIPCKAKAAGPLHDLHALQARGDGRRLCRCADAGLSRLCGRGDRRQRVLHQGQGDHDADARLLPQRHHPADADRAGQGQWLHGHRAAHQARRTQPVRRVLPDRHCGGSDAGVRGRRISASRRARPAGR